MSIIQIQKTQQPTPMETDLKNQTPHHVNDDSTQKLTYADRCQYVMLDFVAVEAIDYPNN